MLEPRLVQDKLSASGQVTSRGLTKTEDFPHAGGLNWASVMNIEAGGDLSSYAR